MKTIALPKHTGAMRTLAPEQVEMGAPVPPLTRVRGYSPDDWEDFVLEWAESLRDKYVEVHKPSGAGDKGRDVIGYLEEPSSAAVWNNYQCKHYENPLMPTDVWVELGKLCHYTFIGEFTKPRQYRFVAPRDVGPKLAKFFRKPDLLRSELIKNWAQYCEKQIGDTPVPLSAELLSHVEAYDFSTVGFVPVLTLLREHRTTPFYVTRFGGGLPPRTTGTPVATEIDGLETRYVAQLYLAYGDHTSDKIAKPDDLLPHSKLHKHFHRARESFYSAEALRNFSRDHLPVGEYEALQDQVYDGVIGICEDQHDDGYLRVRAVCDHAGVLQLVHPLRSRLFTKDRTGICHQLANADRLRWVEYE